MSEQRPLLGDSVQQTTSVWTPTRTGCYRNLALMSLSCTVVFTAYVSLQNLESSLNQQGGVGVVSLACVNGSLVLCCLLAPAVVKRIRYKWGIALNFCAHGLFVASNFYPVFPLMIPASLALGFGGAIFWTSQGMFISSLAQIYSRETGDELSTIVSRFSSVAFMCFQS